MTPQKVLSVLRARWIVVLVVTVLAAGAGGALFALRTPEYTAKVKTYVSARATSDEGSAYQGGLLSQQRVTSYVELVGSEPVAEAVITKLSLDESPEALMAQISAVSAPDSVLIDIFVVDTSPARAAQIANAAAEAFIALVGGLEGATGTNGVADVVVSVVAPAKVPAAASGTGLPTYLAIGVLLGLGLGVAAAFARDALDTSVTSASQLGTLVGAPVFGTITENPLIHKQPLTVLDDPHSPAAEAFRHLRTNLQFVQVDTPSRVITVTSSVASEGKSTTVCNLAIALASTGGRVLLVDADLRRPAAAELLGLDTSMGLTNVLVGRSELGQVMQSWHGGMFDVLASGPLPPNPSELLSSKRMEAVLAQLRESYDYVLIDTPPLLPVTDAAVLTPYTDGAILVCRHRETGKGEVTAARARLEGVSAEILGVVLTMVPAGSAEDGYSGYPSYGRPVDAEPSVIPRTQVGPRPSAAATAHDRPRAEVPAGPAPTGRHAGRPEQRSGQHAVRPDGRPGVRPDDGTTGRTNGRPPPGALSPRSPR